MKWALVIILSVMTLFGITIFSSYVKYHDAGVALETGIKAQWEENENILAQYSLKIKEMAQIPDMYTNDLKEVYREALGGRYGEDGSKAVMQWIQEQNPQLSPDVYINIQQAMEAGRNKFENGQTILVDRKRTYETMLGKFWSGMFLRFAGFPKINLDDYKIISSSHARGAFETGIDEGIKLN